MDNLPRSRTPPRWTSAWRRPGSCGPAVGDITDCSAAALVPAAPLAVIAATGGGANGVFVDGCHHVALADCQYSTCGEDGASCCHVSPHAELEFNQVTWSLATCSPTVTSQCAGSGPGCGGAQDEAWVWQPGHWQWSPELRLQRGQRQPHLRHVCGCCRWILYGTRHGF